MDNLLDGVVSASYATWHQSIARSDVGFNKGGALNVIGGTLARLSFVSDAANVAISGDRTIRREHEPCAFNGTEHAASVVEKIHLSSLCLIMFKEAAHDIDGANLMHKRTCTAI